MIVALRHLARAHQTFVEHHRSGSDLGQLDRVNLLSVIRFLSSGRERASTESSIISKRCLR
ncbi:hypothetical protein B0T14DRAFT_7347 [Immersiella caudata]|uniref:Uncharacterized protein n=1 Tax=Immersiella caudata TaxID=314043 RepID=A0AA39XDJ6_9PEZI|nr:hypothetical protein B0T14DRAFT_7347 [Immersiella caudata]